ncbi:hypothetical protein BPSY_2219 [Bifidobacterium psychraerophilum]|uniref:Uncharacterized protein n=1 Tax=Bifidobacterium psychraerophilum TaxID=218140 RepID=A0A087CHI9_9BIFI|nr:hypothetical protein BPSY_2219 [Bifidobacterium psychraerophilum]
MSHGQLYTTCIAAARRTVNPWAHRLRRLRRRTVLSRAGTCRKPRCVSLDHAKVSHPGRFLPY